MERTNFYKVSYTFRKTKNFSQFPTLSLKKEKDAEKISFFPKKVLPRKTSYDSEKKKLKSFIYRKNYNQWP